MRSVRACSAIILTPEGLLLTASERQRAVGVPGGAWPGIRSAAVVREVRRRPGSRSHPSAGVVYSAPENGEVVTTPGNVIHYVSSSFECRIVGGALEPGVESLEVRWFDPDRLPAELMPMHRIRVFDALACQPAPFVR